MASPNASPPDGLNADAGLPVPPGASPDRIALGDQIFHGKMDGGTCTGCANTDGKESSVGSDLTSGKYLWGDGSVQSIMHTIEIGAPTPKEHTGAMPPLGGAKLSQGDLASVADYVWALGHKNAQR
jgi:hypothetical protein